MTTNTVREDEHRSTEAAEPAGHPYRWAGLALVLLVEAMDLLDATITGVASPAILRELGGGESQIQWIAAAYTLAFATLLVTGARLGDIFGRKRLFLVGAAGFTLASAACAAATDPGLLIAGRAVQGGFAALLIPQGLGLIRAMFPPKEQGAAFGLFAPVLGLSSVLGPTLGGLLVDADWWGTGWRLVFLVNLPLGVVAVLAGSRLLPANRLTRAEETVRLDLPGAALTGLASVLLVYPLVQGREADWPLWTYLSMAAAVPVLLLFARTQRSVRQRGGSPLVEPSLFRRRAFTGALATGVVFFGAFAGLMLVLTLHLQLGLGWTPVHAGLTMIPLSLGLVAGAVLSGGVLAPKYGRRVLHGGLLTAALGALALWLTVLAGGSGLTTWQLLPALVLEGFGLGLIMAPFFDIALAGVEEHEVGSASGVLNAVQQLGGSIGVAVLGTAFFGWAAADGSAPGAGRTLGLTALALLAAAALAFLLPRQARPEGGGHHG
ncbi:MFS transporter [Kitasatospora sp. NPDC096147]|uniref:MFS transporter n=1 Tax=Kitasatospora sp. NPDC096147 TaxID=3364093 RepID=UPI00380926B7